MTVGTLELEDTSNERIRDKYGFEYILFGQPILVNAEANIYTIEAWCCDDDADDYGVLRSPRETDDGGMCIIGENGGTAYNYVLHLKPTGGRENALLIKDCYEVIDTESEAKGIEYRKGIGLCKNSNVHLPDDNANYIIEKCVNDIQWKDRESAYILSTKRHQRNIYRIDESVHSADMWKKFMTLRSSIRQVVRKETGMCYESIVYYIRRESTEKKKQNADEICEVAPFAVSEFAKLHTWEAVKYFDKIYYRISLPKRVLFSGNGSDSIFGYQADAVCGNDLVVSNGQAPLYYLRWNIIINDDENALLYNNKIADSVIDANAYTFV